MAIATARQVRLFIAAAAVVLMMAGLMLVPNVAHAAVSVSCGDVSYVVNVSGAQRTLRGTLCRPGGQPKAVAVLLHGTTYSRTYWHFPVDTGRYSALRQLAANGYLTLALDRLGSGDSDRPPVAETGPDVETAAVHQVVSQLREDPANATRSGKVFLIGHSSGSVLALGTSARYNNVDGVVTTGFLHAAGPGGNFFGAMVHPAAEDPKYANANLPAGYVTTRPGTRITFYNPYNADERVIAMDEQTKGALPGADPSYVQERDTKERARQITVPVFVITGSHDLLVCTPPDCPEAAQERQWYSASPDVRVVVRPRTGHNLHLHRNAPETTKLIVDWLNAHI